LALSMWAVIGELCVEMADEEAEVGA